MLICADITFQSQGKDGSIRLLENYPMNDDDLTDTLVISMALNYIDIKSEKQKDWKVKSVTQKGKIGL